MNDITKSESNDLISMLHRSHNGLSVPIPFERDIYLFDTYIAGTGYVKDMETIAARLAVGDKVQFFREPNNKYDKHAIVIKNTDGKKLGYVPRQDNAVFSRLMDAGKMLFAKISSKGELRGNWIDIDIQIFLHE